MTSIIANPITLSAEEQEEERLQNVAKDEGKILA